MVEQALFTTDDEVTRVELTYEADKSLMPAKDLGEAILGMTTCLKIAGRVTKIDFEDVYVYAIEEGSVKTFFVYVRRNQNRLIADVGTNVVGVAIVGAFGLIGTYGLAALKSPSGDMLKGAEKNAITLCLSADFRRSVVKIARPINEINKKVTIKFGDKGYEITCDNQYKFTNEDEDPILPELRNGETVSLSGTLTRMNMVPKNDLGFSYKGKIISLSPLDPDKNVATEYHQYTPLPQVIVTGVIVRENDFEIPRIKVIRMDKPKNDQIQMFDQATSEASDSALQLNKTN